LDLQIGDVVRVPLGSRQHLGFVVSPARRSDPQAQLRPIVERLDVPRAFTALGLQLARFVADRYVCTLGEALHAVVLSGALPRTVDTFVRTVHKPSPQRYSAVPKRLLRLIWEEFAEGFTLEQLLRHPEARRAGDRRTLLRSITALVRSGDMRRARAFMRPRTQEYRVKVLQPGSGEVRGPKASLLVRFVRDNPGVPRADALLAGFSNPLLARAIKAGAIREEAIAPQPSRLHREPAPQLFTPTQEQHRAIAALRERLNGGGFHETLLYGVTGSGKTFVYIQAIEQVVRSGGCAIVLVPEISLTPQTARRFEQAFGERVAVLHSALSERERHDAWQACAAGVVDVVVGARSAVFAPLENVRLIVVDEAHESSYKQESAPRYDAVTVARERMRLEGGLLVLGSATPSLESYAAARSEVCELLTLRRRATRQTLPSVRIVDMAAQFHEGNRRIFSDPLAQALDDRLKRREKSVLFVNRRGSASFMLCRSCGSVPQCNRCTVSLTVHRGEGLLRCHYCDAQRALPSRCAVCGSDAIREFGVGTQRVAEEVQRLYPHTRIVRMDSDTTTRIGDHARLLDEFGESGDVLVGTQMVAKGLDFPSVTLAAVVAADIGLHMPDFRAAERSFALIAQVCGRSGRGSPGEAIVQTYSPDHPAIRFAAAHDYEGFAAQELADRAQSRYPPACALLYLGVIGRNRNETQATAGAYAQALCEAGAGEVLGPAPYPIARMNEEWRFRIALKDDDGATMRAAVRELILPRASKQRATRVAINVDP